MRRLLTTIFLILLQPTAGADSLGGLLQDADCEQAFQGSPEARSSENQEEDELPQSGHARESESKDKEETPDKQEDGLSPKTAKDFDKALQNGNYDQLSEEQLNSVKCPRARDAISERVRSIQDVAKLSPAPPPNPPSPPAALQSELAPRPLYTPPPTRGSTEAPTTEPPPTFKRNEKGLFGQDFVESVKNHGGTDAFTKEGVLRQSAISKIAKKLDFGPSPSVEAKEAAKILRSLSPEVLETIRSGEPFALEQSVVLREPGKNTPTVISKEEFLAQEKFKVEAKIANAREELGKLKDWGFSVEIDGEIRVSDPLKFEARLNRASPEEKKALEASGLLPGIFDPERRHALVFGAHVIPPFPKAEGERVPITSVSEWNRQIELAKKGKENTERYRAILQKNGIQVPKDGAEGGVVFPEGKGIFTKVKEDAELREALNALYGGMGDRLAMNAVKAGAVEAFNEKYIAPSFSERGKAWREKQAKAEAALKEAENGVEPENAPLEISTSLRRLAEINRLEKSISSQRELTPAEKEQFRLSKAYVYDRISELTGGDAGYSDAYRATIRQRQDEIVNRYQDRFNELNPGEKMSELTRAQRVRAELRAFDKEVNGSIARSGAPGEPSIEALIQQNSKVRGWYFDRESWKFSRESFAEKALLERFDRMGQIANRLHELGVAPELTTGLRKLLGDKSTRNAELVLAGADKFRDDVNSAIVSSVLALGSFGTTAIATRFIGGGAKTAQAAMFSKAWWAAQAVKGGTGLAFGGGMGGGLDAGQQWAQIYDDSKLKPGDPRYDQRKTHFDYSQLFTNTGKGAGIGLPLAFAPKWAGDAFGAYMSGVLSGPQVYENYKNEQWAQLGVNFLAGEVAAPLLPIGIHAGGNAAQTRFLGASEITPARSSAGTPDAIIHGNEGGGPPAIKVSENPKPFSLADTLRETPERVEPPALRAPVTETLPAKAPSQKTFAQFLYDRASQGISELPGQAKAFIEKHVSQIRASVASLDIPSLFAQASQGTQRPRESSDAAAPAPSYNKGEGKKRVNEYDYGDELNQLQAHGAEKNIRIYPLNGKIEVRAPDEAGDSFHVFTPVKNPSTGKFSHYEVVTTVEGIPGERKWTTPHPPESWEAIRFRNNPTFKKVREDDGSRDLPRRDDSKRRELEDLITEELEKWPGTPKRNEVVRKKLAEMAEAEEAKLNEREAELRAAALNDPIYEKLLPGIQAERDPLRKLKERIAASPQKSAPVSENPGLRQASDAAARAPEVSQSPVEKLLDGSVGPEKFAEFKAQRNRPDETARDMQEWIETARDKKGQYAEVGMQGKFYGEERVDPNVAKVPESERPVHYFSEAERATFEVSFDPQGRPFYSQSKKSVPAGSYLAVMDSRGTLYMIDPSTMPEGTLKHSSVLAGKPVAFAGHIDVGEGGLVASASNSSGHYLPHPAAVGQVFAELQSRNVDLKNTKFTIELGGPQDHDVFALKDVPLFPKETPLSTGRTPSAAPEPQKSITLYQLRKVVGSVGLSTLQDFENMSAAELNEVRNEFRRKMDSGKFRMPELFNPWMNAFIGGASIAK